eukprot:354829-Pelagomonas_calceolata.AAC.2
MENARHNVEDVRHHATAQKWRILPCAVTAWHAVNAQGLHVCVAPKEWCVCVCVCVCTRVGVRARAREHACFLGKSKCCQAAACSETRALLRRSASGRQTKTIALKMQLGSGMLRGCCHCDLVQTRSACSQAAACLWDAVT